MEAYVQMQQRDRQSLAVVLESHGVIVPRTDHRMTLGIARGLFVPLSQDFVCCEE
jgi:hypothetical protein